AESAATGQPAFPPPADCPPLSAALTCSAATPRWPAAPPSGSRLGACHNYRACVAGWLRSGILPRGNACAIVMTRSEEHTSELQSRSDLVCRLLLEKKKKKKK